MPGVTKVGVLGGTFDPPHLGHMAVAQDAVEGLGLDRVLLIPAQRSPHKDSPPEAPGPERLRMLREAVAGDPRFETHEPGLHDVDQGGADQQPERVESQSLVHGRLLWRIRGRGIGGPASAEPKAMTQKLVAAAAGPTALSAAVGDWDIETVGDRETPRLAGGL